MLLCLCFSAPSFRRSHGEMTMHACPSVQQKRKPSGTYSAGAFFVLAVSVCAHTADADVQISTAPSKNISCSNGICAPTAASALLNVSDLETMLASGDVSVTTAGAGVQANDIAVIAPFTWSSESKLTLDAYESVSISASVSVTGQGGLSLLTNDGGAGGILLFGQTGSATFANLSSALTINGTAYTLVNSVSTLAAAVAANPAGNFALANSYDASADGLYHHSPVETPLTGAVDGLGNTISNLSIKQGAHSYKYQVGLFAESLSGSSISALKLSGYHVVVTGGKKGIETDVGGLIGGSSGSLVDDHVSGGLKGTGSYVGGLAGYAVNVTQCSARVSISAETTGIVGGLIGDTAGGVVDQSYATGRISADVASVVGGLVGENNDEVDDSYSTVNIRAAAGSAVGGAVGWGHSGNIDTSYSTGSVPSGQSGEVGGLIGDLYATGASDNYWDTDTSGTNQGTGEGNVSGVTGESTEQLKASLPSGFDSTI